MKKPLPEQESKSADLEKFAQILGKCCLDNKVNLTSNERHTVYDAFKEYAQSHQVEMPSDECNHVIGANDNSGVCLECGKKVCEIINNDLCQK